MRYQLMSRKWVIFSDTVQVYRKKIAWQHQKIPISKHVSWYIQSSLLIIWSQWGGYKKRVVWILDSFLHSHFRQGNYARVGQDLLKEKYLLYTVYTRLLYVNFFLQKTDLNLNLLWSSIPFLFYKKFTIDQK
jgi:hypothetical protein